MLDYQEAVFDIVPSVLGLIIVTFAVYLILRRREEFFSAIRGWIIALFVLALAALWALELLDDYTGGWYHRYHAAVDVTFIVVAAWLSVCTVTLTTIYRRFGSFAHFANWLRKSPVNIITAWGTIGLVLVAVAWILNPEVDADPDAWLGVTAAVSAYLVVSIGLNFALPMRSQRSGGMGAISKNARSDMYLLAGAWMGIPAVELVFDLVLELRFGYEEYNPYSWLMVGLFVVVVRSVTSKEFTAIIVDPEVESTARSGFRGFDIPRGIYFFEGDSGDAAFKLFSELVSFPLRPDIDLSGKEDSASDTLQFLIPSGLVVTREFPENVRKAYGLEVTPIIWLTESQGERRIAPTSIAVLTDTMIRFMESNPNSIVLLEGVEYLTTFNDFKRVLKSLDSLTETAWVTRARLIISVDPKAFDSKELATLERDRKVLRGAAAVEELKKESRIESVAVSERA
jgi:hypothetical protein